MKIIDSDSTKENLEKLIASGYLHEAILNIESIVQKRFRENPTSEKLEQLHDSIILLISKYNFLKKGIVRGDLEQNYIDVERMKISKSLIEMIKSLSESTSSNPIPHSSHHVALESGDASSKAHIREGEIAQVRTVELTIDADFENYTAEDQQRLLRAIRELLGVRDKLIINKIRKGSVILSFDIPEDRYDFLLHLFRSGHLDAFKVTKLDDEERLIIEAIESSSPPQFSYVTGLENYKGGTNIFVARLNPTTSEDDLRLLFEDYGEVVSVKLIMDRIAGGSKGYGFIEMSHEVGAFTAIQNLNNFELDGRRIVVKSVDENRRDEGGRDGRSLKNWRDKK